jgi:hypothetical protein
MVTLYMLAAMQAIPQDLYEAAWTDGAGRFYRFRRITMPLIVPSMITMSMLSLISTFNSFDIIWILTRGGPSGETTTMIIDTYRTAIGSNKYGEGCCARGADLHLPVDLLRLLLPPDQPPCIRRQAMKQPPADQSVHMVRDHRHLCRHPGVPHLRAGAVRRRLPGLAEAAQPAVFVALPLHSRKRLVRGLPDDVDQRAGLRALYLQLLLHLDHRHRGRPGAGRSRRPTPSPASSSKARGCCSARFLRSTCFPAPCCSFRCSG